MQIPLTYFINKRFSADIFSIFELSLSCLLPLNLKLMSLICLIWIILWIFICILIVHTYEEQHNFLSRTYLIAIGDNFCYVWGGLCKMLSTLEMFLSPQNLYWSFWGLLNFLNMCQLMSAFIDYKKNHCFEPTKFFRKTTTIVNLIRGDFRLLLLCLWKAT